MHKLHIKKNKIKNLLKSDRILPNCPNKRGKAT